MDRLDRLDRLDRGVRLRGKRKGCPVGGSLGSWGSIPTLWEKGSRDFKEGIGGTLGLSPPGFVRGFG